MSERRFNDSPAPEDEEALRGAWQADTPPMPDAALDARVRAAVEAEIAAAAPAHGASVIRPRRWQRLSIPLALAATLLLSFGAIRVMFPTVLAPQPMVLEGQQAAPAAPPQAEGDAAVAPAAPAAAKASGAPIEAGSSSLAEESGAAPRQNIERRREASATGAIRAPAADLPKALPVAPVPAEAANGSAGSSPATLAAPAARSELGALRDDAPPSGLMKRGAAQQQAAPSSAPAPQRAGRGAEDSESPAAVLARIRAQRDRGERAAAARALEEWVKANPQAELPDWARALLAESRPLRP